MKTFSIKPSEIKKKWHIVDAKDLILGRLAAKLAPILRGKHKPEFTPHLDCGDYIVVINAQHVHLTGDKLSKKKFYWHTGYPGGIKERTIGKILGGAHPERVLRKAVERMLPKGTLGRLQLKNMFVYPHDTHPHQAQQPHPLDLGSFNRKNKKAE